MSGTHLEVPDPHVASRLLNLSRTDVESVGLDMRSVIELLDAAFREKAAGRVEMPPKPGIHPAPDAFIHAMPSLLPSLHSGGIKWVSGFPANLARGLPHISGLIILNDVETGLPTAVMDCTWITACRTGASSALSARHLARPESAVLGVLGCGVQGRTHLEAMAAVFHLQLVLAYDHLRDNAERYADDPRRVAQPRCLRFGGGLRFVLASSGARGSRSPEHRRPRAVRLL